MLKWITAPLDAVFRRSAHGCGRAGNEPVAASADSPVPLAVVGEGPAEEEETIYRLVSWGFRPPP